MATIVGIQFQKNGTLYYYDANSLTVQAGDYVIAESGHGLDLAEVVVGCREVEEDQVSAEIQRLIRVATPQDIQRSIENRERERQAYGICQRKIAEHNLEMKLVSVEYTFDSSKILFYFTANGRVDFRALVKDLASVFKTRIELRQIGVRDEARMLGVLGQCGRPICCGAFLADFQPVSIKMAKEQNLSLNPTKISGVCGRLMCCLKYEQEQYEQVRKRMPKMGREIKTPDGNGTVIDMNILKETVTVRFQNGDSSESRVYTLEALGRGVDAKPQGSVKNDAEFPGTDAALNETTSTDDDTDAPENAGMFPEKVTEFTDETAAEMITEIDSEAAAGIAAEISESSAMDWDSEEPARMTATAARVASRTDRPKQNNRQERHERGEKNPNGKSLRRDKTSSRLNSVNMTGPKESTERSVTNARLKEPTEKTVRKTSNSQLGQPVKRENPQRKKTTTGNWAAEVEKAMLNIDKI